MKPTLLSCLVFLLAGTAARAQFSLLPQIGFEQSRTSLNYGNGLSAMNANANVKAGLKMDYKLKSGHTPFINLTTVSAPDIFTFSNTGALIDRFQSGTPKLMLQAGYQYSSKAIQLGKKTAANKSMNEVKEEANMRQYRCGSMGRSRCGQQRSMSKFNSLNNALNMRLQPALALAYVPSATPAIAPKGDGFEYKAANWKTALVPSMGFEFAKGQQRLFTVSVFYTKPLAQTDEIATLASGAKAISVPLQAKTSSWGLTLGIPFSFTKPSQLKTRRQSKPIEKKECRRYYHRCNSLQLN
jgi:hypothetical protein